MNQGSPIEPTAACGDHFSAIFWTEIRGSIFAVEPEWRIQFITKPAIHGEIRSRAPGVLRVERIAADVVIHLKSVLEDGFGDVAEQIISDAEARRVSVKSLGEDRALRGFEIEEVERIFVVLITKLQAMPADQLVNIVDNLV